MTRRGAWLALALVSIVSAAAADELVDRVATSLGRPDVLRASFTQEKRAAALTRPILSRGRLTVARDHGVIWRIDAPLSMSIAYRADALVEVDSDGRRRVKKFADNRVQAEVARVIRALLAADFAALRQHFDVQGSGDAAAQWRIELFPRPGPVGQFISALVVSGGRHVEQIRVIEAGGDSTVIRLSDIQTPAGLDPDEQSLLLDR